MLSEVFDTPNLIASLARFSEARETSRSSTKASSALQGPRSILFLQIFLAADYYSTNESLMKDVPPVLVDISKWQQTLSLAVTNSSSPRSVASQHSSQVPALDSCLPH